MHFWSQRDAAQTLAPYYKADYRHMQVTPITDALLLDKVIELVLLYRLTLIRQQVMQ